MSRDYNRVILMGRLAKDPDVRTTPSGQKVARFSLANGREWKDKVTGEKKQETQFHPVQAWGRVAETLGTYTHKGDRLLIEGRLSSRDFDDPKTGVHRWVTEVVADTIIMLGSKGGAQGQAAGASAPSASAQAAQYYPGNVDMGTLRNEAGFEEDFPLDFSELSGGGDDISIPF